MTVTLAGDGETLQGGSQDGAMAGGQESSLGFLQSEEGAGVPERREDQLLPAMLACLSPALHCKNKWKKHTPDRKKGGKKTKPQTASHGLPQRVWAKALAWVTCCCFSREAAGAKFAFTTNRDNTMS